MPVKYIPYYPETIDGQAILDNFVRTRRMLRYKDSDKVGDRLKRGMPLYEVEELEKVNGGGDNLVIRGECVSACAYLKDKGIKVDLVYIDPPFASGADYAKKIYLRKNPAVAKAMDSAAELEDDELKAFEEKMYGDIWNKEQYLNWMYENLVAIRSVMSETASIYVHLDWHIGHYAKILMDEVFGEDNFRNEIIWHYYNKMQGNVNRFASNHDVILWYSAGESFTFNPQKEERDEPIEQIKRVWSKQSKKLVNAKDDSGKVIYQESTHKSIDDVWRLSMIQPADTTQNVDYATQKPEPLLERVLSGSSNEAMIVADFFGGSGVTAKVANDLGRKFIHCDVGINSIQTARDRLAAVDAKFNVLNIEDGVSLFRNPAQTMDKLKNLIHGLRNEDSLDSFWEGAIEDSKKGLIPVYVPNLLDHSNKVLDIPAMNRIINEAMPDLPDDISKVIVYYIDIEDRKDLERFIKEQNETNIEIELRDLKEVLDNVVLGDSVTYEVKKSGKEYVVEVQGFVSDRLIQKIDEFNQKRKLQMLNKRQPLIEVAEIGEIEDEPEGGFKEITVSENGLELIEMISLDCTNAKGSWKSDAEIKIDKNSFVIQNGKKTREFWDGTISAKKKPKRLKIRNIAGDESIIAV